MREDDSTKGRIVDISRCTNACRMSAYKAGDEIAFKFEGNLRATVERVSFRERGRIVYHVSTTLSFEVPEREVIRD